MWDWRLQHDKAKNEAGEMVRVVCGRILGHVYRGHGVALAAADLPGGNGDLLPQR